MRFGSRLVRQRLWTARRRPACIVSTSMPAVALPAVRMPAVALLTVALVSLALWGCGTTATDNNEPNDDLNSATVLVPGEPADGIIGPDDSEIFSCEAPAGDVTHPFTVTVRTEAPQDIEMQVGASIPGVWEGITWPGWEVVTKDDRLELGGTLRKGTVIVAMKGASDTAYSIEIAWE